MKRLHYGAHALLVADDVADMVTTLSTELANAGRMSAVPIAAVPDTVQVTIGVGVMLLVADAPDSPESSESMESWAYMPAELEALQAEDGDQ
jgi:hypothetical protein